MSHDKCDDEDEDENKRESKRACKKQGCDEHANGDMKSQQNEGDENCHQYCHYTLQIDCGKSSPQTSGYKLRLHELGGQRDR